MSESSDSHDAAKARAACELAGVNRQIDAMRAVLSRMSEDMRTAGQLLDGDRADKLLEANEQLIAAALRDQTHASNAVQALNEASRIPALDPLTQLPNRALLLDRCENAMAGAKRHHTRLGLLFFGIDKFRQINDSLGQEAGDQVLQMTARCIVSSARAVDTVSRYGGDEFLVLLTDVSEVAHAVEVANKLKVLLGVPRRIGDQMVHLTVSVGIAFYPDDGDDGATLIERARSAMHHAQSCGLGTCVFGPEPVEAGQDAVASPGSAPHAARPPVTSREPAPAGEDLQHAQLQDANTHLVLAALSAQELQAAAEDARRQQTEFLAVVAHELRNPLAPIRIAATLLGRIHTDEPLLPRAQAIIERQVAQMSRLINDLLDVARGNIGKLRLEWQAVEMGDTVAMAIEACRPAMDARQQQLTVERPAQELKVHGDPHRLVQVLSNLLENASKYTPDGGVIGLSVVATDETLVVTVSDNGIGMAAETLPKIFDPFVQDTHAVDFNRVGVGLGLTVVRELVGAHHGSVVASSEGVGLGSRFVVTLPLIR